MDCFFRSLPTRLFRTAGFAAAVCLLGVLPAQAQSIKELRIKAQPSEAHEKLEALEGEWTIRIQYRRKTDTNPERAVGKAQFRWILGKRFLEQTLQGSGRASSYTGQGIIGYDNVAETYVCTWVDTMNSGITHGKGQLMERDGQLIWQFLTTATDPATGEAKQYETFFRVLDENSLQYILYDTQAETGERVALINIGYRRE